MNGSIIWSLVKGDIKARYASSIFGMLWVFALPMTNILLIWFAFTFGLRTHYQDGHPFVLWLLSGMVPWVYFSDAVLNATNSILEKSFLVKKVVFAVELLPLIKIIVSSLVYIFLLMVFGFFLVGYGYMPDVHWFQVVYYTICLMALIFSLAWIASSLVIFYRDLSQVISVFLQIGFWATPIVWTPENLPEKFRFIAFLNPVNYVITGFRNAFFLKTWPWEDLAHTVYFWVLIFTLISISWFLFRKLRPHFADLI